MAYIPIWKDYPVTLGTGSSYDFEIRLDDSSGAVIYSGRAHKRPGAASVITRVNDICAAYLAERLPALNIPAGFTSFAVAQTFCVRALVSGTWTTKATIDFYNDWSYDHGFNPATMPLSDPITGELDPRQHLVFSTLPASSLTAVLTFADGTSSSIVIPIARSADFNNDFNNDFSLIDTAAHGGAAVVDLSAFTGLASVTIGGVTYKVRQDACPRYALYYVNAYGGWDSLLIDGPDRRIDGYDRHTMDMDYDNADTAARGREDYAIEVTPTLELRTGYLTDQQSARMHHLLGSTQVFVCDLPTGAVRPVVLTNAECDYKRYKTGRTLNAYTITAQVAQQFVRR
jgi:hypothetical protein